MIVIAKIYPLIEFWGVYTLMERGYCPAVAAMKLPIMDNAIRGKQMKDQMRNGSARGVQRPTAVQSQLNRLHDHLTTMACQMRRYLLRLCGTTEAAGDNVVHHMRRLRQRMFATRRRISDLKDQNRTRN